MLFYGSFSRIILLMANVFFYTRIINGKRNKKYEDVQSNMLSGESLSPDLPYHLFNLNQDIFGVLEEGPYNTTNQIPSIENPLHLNDQINEGGQYNMLVNEMYNNNENNLFSYTSDYTLQKRAVYPECCIKEQKYNYMIPPICKEGSFELQLKSLLFDLWHEECRQKEEEECVNSFKSSSISHCTEESKEDFIKKCYRDFCNNRREEVMCNPNIGSPYNNTDRGMPIKEKSVHYNYPDYNVCQQINPNLPLNEFIRLFLSNIHTLTQRIQNLDPTMRIYIECQLKTLFGYLINQLDAWNQQLCRL